MLGTARALPAVPDTAGPFGQGITYPPTFTTAGRLQLSSGVTLVDQALLSICQTTPGERCMQPDYGIASLLFEPVRDLDRTRVELQDNIADHEPRIDGATVGVAVVDASQNAVEIAITYQPAGEANARTLTAPFYSGPAATSTGV